MRLASCILLFAISAIAQHTNDTSMKNPFRGNTEAVEAGRKQYLTSCSGCHGPTAEGGRGPRLNNRRGRANADERLFTSIKNGIAGSDMPPSPLPDDKIWQMVTYVQNINAPAFESKPPGDPEAGRAIFTGKGGCRECHRLRGEGGFLGPDLSNVGMQRSVTLLREALLKPSERTNEGYTGVKATFRDGRHLEGVARDNTNYRIVIMDKAGELHIVPREKLSEVVFKKGSLMPNDFAQRLTKDELRDLIAFLSRQALRSDSKGN
jgi:putative heme-binding domain-containing protein